MCVPQILFFNNINTLYLIKYTFLIHLSLNNGYNLTLYIINFHSLNGTKIRTIDSFKEISTLHL